MRKFLSITAVFILLSTQGFSQNTLQPNNTLGNNSSQPTYHSRKTHINPEFCATDDFHNDRMNNDNAYRLQHLETIKKLKKISAQKNPVNGIYQVPVVVHVMHKGEAVGSGTNISDAEVKAGIQYLNNFWRKVAGSYGDGNGVDMEIEFTLAIQDEFGNCTDGIDRVDMSSVTAYVNNGVNRNNSNGLDDYNSGGGINSLKEYSIWDPTEFYNVWIVDEIDNKNCYTGGSYTAGYAYYASSHGQPWDGSVVLICSYTDESADTWAHEMGHAFNLPHTFDGDNYPSTCGDDGISDTPMHYRTSDIPGLYFDCGNTDPNTCDPSFNEVMSPTHTGDGTHQDHMLNYMDYTGCSSEFTTGQRTVAKAAMTGARGSFLSGYALTPPLPATVDFSASAAVACQGSSVTFTDESTCTPNTYTNTGYTGITFSWTFDNGVDVPYTSTDQNPTITFSNAGTYDVTLEITNPQGTTNLTKTGYISVASAPVASCSPTTSNTGNFSLAVTNVDFNTISNATGTTNAAYTNYTCSHNTTIDNVSSYNLDVDIAGGSGYTEYAEIWIDWDNSGAFESTNSNGIDELVLSGSTPDATTNTLSTSITAPASATLNTLLRMRVIGEANSTPSLCGNNFVGDCEDYGIYVTVACTNPTITTQPTAQSGCAGDNETYTVASATGTFQWQEDQGSGFANISNGGVYSGATTNTLTLTGITAPMNGYDYRCVVTDGSCFTNSNSAALTVTSSPTITTQPTAQSGCVSDNETFTVAAATGTFQWQEDQGSGFANISNGGVYSGATTNTLTLTGITAPMNGYDYRCVVTDGSCSTTSNSASLTVNEAPGAAGSITGSTSECENATGVAYSITAVSGATSYNWGLPTGATIASGTGTNSITVNFGTNSGTVSVTPNNTCGNGGTANKSVTINVCGSAPVADFSGTPTTLCEGNTVSFTDLSTNTPTSWSWSFTGGTPSSSTAQNPTITYNTAGTYPVTLTATNSFGSDPITKTGYITVNACGTTKLRTQDCGLVMSSYLNYINCDYVAGATEYEYEFSNSGLGYNQTYIRSSNWRFVYVYLVPGIIGNTTYDVRVRAKVGGIWSSYGNVCQITTPVNTVSTQLRSSDCGLNMTSYSNYIQCDYVANATDYEYEFSNSGLGYSQTYTRPSNWRFVYVNNVPGININTTYDVRVRANVGGSWTSYGTTCQITTPASARIGFFPENEIESTIDKVYANLDMKLYPNPSQGEFVYLELKGLSSNAKIIVTDLFGKTILDQPINSEYESYNETLRFNKKLDAGFYMVTVASGNQKITKKLVVQ